MGQFLIIKPGIQDVTVCCSDGDSETKLEYSF